MSRIIQYAKKTFIEYCENKNNFFNSIINIWKKNDKFDRWFLASFIFLLFTIILFFTLEINILFIPILIGAIGVINELSILFDKLWSRTISKALLVRLSLLQVL